MNTEVVALLKRVLERIAVPERWTKGEAARTEKGRGVSENDIRACRWCAWGALRLEGRPPRGQRKDWRAAALAALNSRSPRTQSTKNRLTAFNDRRATTHADMIALLTRTIAELEAAE